MHTELQENSASHQASLSPSQGSGVSDKGRALGRDLDSAGNSEMSAP